MYLISKTEALFQQIIIRHDRPKGKPMRVITVVIHNDKLGEHSVPHAMVRMGTSVKFNALFPG